MYCYSVGVCVCFGVGTVKIIIFGILPGCNTYTLSTLYVLY